MDKMSYTMQHHNYVAIIDYGMGNLFNVQRACSKVGLQSVITSDKSAITNSSGIILPGVGAFGDAMINLKKIGLIGVLKDQIALNKPLLGICLGMQLLFSESQEFGKHEGLNVIKGQVLRFANTDRYNGIIKVPQVGWNRIFYNVGHSANQDEDSPLFNIANAEFMYFVHSYYVVPFDCSYILTSTHYGNTEYCSSLLKGSIFAVQFHPEKSANPGLQIYKNWAKIVESYDKVLNR